MLQTAALVNEAYVRLVDQNNIQWERRSHFFGLCANNESHQRQLVDRSSSAYRELQDE